ncbi:MAG: hypothetical protein RIS35_352, partial [Pseudomonadota bacterium]
AEAKRCAERVVSRMKPDDVVSLVAFDWRASVLWPATEVGDGRGLLDAIATIAPVKTSGMTNLLGGWRAGLRALDRRKEINFRRVFLMSDGFVNRGVTDAAQIAEECARGAGIGVGTSTYRIGPGPGNGLMTSMARAGRGRGYDQDRDEDRLAPFEQELALLENLALIDPILQISATEEGCTLELVNDLTRLDRNFFLPPVAWGGEAWVALRVHVPKSCVSGYASEIDLLRVRGEALAVDDSLVWLGGSGLPLPLLSIEEWDALEEDELVSRRFAEAQAR